MEETSVALPFFLMCHNPLLFILALQASSIHSHSISELPMAAIHLLHLFQEHC